MAISYDSCPICNGPLVVWGEARGHALDACTGCGFVFVNPRANRTEIAQMYRELGGHCRTSVTPETVDAEERRSPNSTVDARRIVERLREYAGRPGRLLDVGCGYGFFSREALRAGFAVDSLEIAPQEREIFRQLTGREPTNVTFEDFEGDPGSYDAILMSQILEHAVDVQEWAARASSLLRPGGVICVAVPNFASFLRRIRQEQDPYIDPPVHLNYFSRVNLEHLLESHGLSPISAETISRVRSDVLSRRLHAPPRVARVLDLLVARGQRIPFAITDRSGLGLFLNVYARKNSHTSDSTHRASAYSDHGRNHPAPASS